MSGMMSTHRTRSRILRLSCALFALSAVAGASLDANAQLRQDLMAPPQRVTVTASGLAGSGKVGDWLNMIPVSMSHSYSMNFGMVGGQYQNVNAYTNHTRFDFSDRLTANLDLAVLHSPFGGSRYLNPLGESRDVRLLVQNASLSYRFSEKGRIDICFSQNPYASGAMGGASGPCSGSSMWGAYRGPYGYPASGAFATPGLYHP